MPAFYAKISEKPHDSTFKTVILDVLAPMYILISKSWCIFSPKFLSLGAFLPQYPIVFVDNHVFLV